MVKGHTQKGGWRTVKTKTNGAKHVRVKTTWIKPHKRKK